MISCGTFKRSFSILLKLNTVADNFFQDNRLHESDHNKPIEHHSMLKAAVITAQITIYAFKIPSIVNGGSSG